MNDVTVPGPFPETDHTALIDVERDVRALAHDFDQDAEEAKSFGNFAGHNQAARSAFRLRQIADALESGALTAWLNAQPDRTEATR